MIARVARLWVAAVALTATAQAAGPEILVTVGEVTDSTAIVWARGRSAGRIDVAYRADGGGGERTASIDASPARDLTGKVALTGLSPGSRYRYRLTQDGARVEGTFVTAPRPSDAAPVRLVWSGDLGSRTQCRHVTDGYPIFRALARVPADFFVFLGDTVYGDHPCGGPDRVPGYDFIATTVPEYRAKHRYNREDAGVQAYFRSLSVYAIWDDHEVKNDFSGPSERLMPIGREAFIDYFPIVPPVEEPGRLYRKFRWGRLVELFILDTRQYRSPNSERDGPAKTMLGAAQKQWLIDSVTSSTATWKLVVSSVSLSVPTGGRNHDSWSNANALGFPEDNGTGFAVERDAILRALREGGVKNLVVLAADVHHAEVIRHHPTPWWSFHEMIAGPLSASFGRPRPLDMELVPKSLFALGGVENFGALSVDESGLTVRVVDMVGTERYSLRIQPER